MANPWLAHVKKTMSENKGLQFKEVLKRRKRLTRLLLPLLPLLLPRNLESLENPENLKNPESKYSRKNIIDS